MTPFNSFPPREREFVSACKSATTEAELDFLHAVYEAMLAHEAVLEEAREKQSKYAHDYALMQRVWEQVAGPPAKPPMEVCTARNWQSYRERGLWVQTARLSVADILRETAKLVPEAVVRRDTFGGEAIAAVVKATAVFVEALPDAGRDTPKLEAAHAALEAAYRKAGL